MRLAVAVLFAMLVSGCFNASISKQQTNNPEIKVELLFEHEGVKVYRFYDGATRYYAVARPGFTVSTDWIEKCGKNCSREQSIATISR